jgi:Ca2+-binding EF-hand superfamily protein
MPRAPSNRRILFLTAVLAVAIASTSGAQGNRVDELFRRFDTNGDGRISHEEFALKKVEIVFASSSVRGASLKFADTQISRPAFDAMDLDRDGVLTAGEVSAAPIFEFENWDANRNNFIEREEFAEGMRRLAR